MKTYYLSVNTLMWNLTLELHDNCAPCLGLIFPIRWVTPPPNFFPLKCFSQGVTFAKSSHSVCLQVLNWVVGNLDGAFVVALKWHLLQMNAIVLECLLHP